MSDEAVRAKARWMMTILIRRKIIGEGAFDAWSNGHAIENGT